MKLGCGTVLTYCFLAYQRQMRLMQAPVQLQGIKAGSERLSQP